MPTPFYHLSVALDLLEHPRLPAGVRRALQRQAGAFFFGHTAPDVQVVSGQSRQATHFFDLPIRPGDSPAWELFWAQYPGLARAAFLPEEQAAFLAGYACHLQADWRWVLHIFAPVFGLHAGWADFNQRLYLHNVLRSYLDLRLLPALPAGLGRSLAGVRPRRWLPFVRDAALREWRDLLAGQLQPGGSVQTVEVFAARQGLDPQEYYRLIASENEMETQVFARLPRSALERYRGDLLEAHLELLLAYYRPAYLQPPLQRLQPGAER